MKKNSKSETSKRDVSVTSARAAKNGNKSSHQRMHPTRSDIPEKLREQICDILNETLANSLDLQTQIKQAHWNVKGVHFYQLHLLFDEMATEMGDYTDLVAERITSLGGTAFGTVRMAAKSTNLPDFPTDLEEGMAFVAALADRFAQYGEMVRENIDVCDHLGDMDSADIFTEISRNVDKRLWFLEAHLQAQSAVKEIGNPRVAARPKH